MAMEEDNLFGEIDDFLNTTTNAFNSTVSSDTNPKNTAVGSTRPAPSHQTEQVRN